LIFFIASSFSFPFYFSLLVKEGTISAFPGGKSAVTEWGREPFSDGRGRTAKCLGDAPKVPTPESQEQAPGHTPQLCPSRMPFPKKAY